MRILYTRNNLPLSILIRKVLGEPVSHSVIEYENGTVCQSNLSGVHTIPSHIFRQKNEIVFEVYLRATLLEETETQARNVDRMGRWYDLPGLLFWGLVSFIKKMTGQPLPDRNMWQNPLSDLCTEVLEDLPERFKVAESLAMVSPFQHFCKITDLLREYEPKK